MICKFLFGNVTFFSDHFENFYSRMGHLKNGSLKLSFSFCNFTLTLHAHFPNFANKKTKKNWELYIFNIFFETSFSKWKFPTFAFGEKNWVLENLSWEMYQLKIWLHYYTSFQFAGWSYIQICERLDQQALLNFPQWRGNYFHYFNIPQIKIKFIWLWFNKFFLRYDLF